MLKHFSSLPEEKQLKLMERLKQKLAANARTNVIQPWQGPGSPPLSFAQQRLWVLDQLDPGNPAYNIPFFFRLRGPLQVPALEWALSEVLRRHNVLRTTFGLVENEPVQIIEPHTPFSLLVTDLSGDSADEQEVRTTRAIQIECGWRFNLAQGPLFRSSLLRLGNEHHILLINIHHIIYDGWSNSIFFREMAELYTAFIMGSPLPLPELPIQYADFSAWQRNWLQGERLAQHIAYWKRVLGDDLPILELPSDKPRPAVFRYRGSSRSRHLPLSLLERIKLLAHDEGATLFMTLLAAYSALLHRYTDQERIIVGTPIASRNQAQIESIIGFFVNMLALSTDLSGNPTFREFLRRIRDVTLGAYEHQDVPFEKLVEALQPQRDPSRTPLFQVAFTLQTFQNNAKMGLELPQVQSEPIEIEYETAKFDLNIFAVEIDHGLLLAAEYNTDVFEAETIDRMLHHFENLLEAIVTNPDQHLAQLSLLNQNELQQMLTQWNDTDRPHTPMCIHHLFEAQVQRNTDAIAAVCEGQVLTYRELNQKANQLAHRLQRLGVGPEVAVGICMERSLDLLIGMLSVLKAGGAYVPLDPSHPTERIAFILSDTRVKVVLTHSALISSLGNQTTPYICLDTDAQATALGRDDNPISAVQPSNLAYILYTSGSTGKPKGVLIEHRSVSNFIASSLAIFGTGPQDRVLQFAAPHFDVSVFSIFGTLLAGAQLIMGVRERLISPPDLTRLMQEHTVTMADLPPAMLGLLQADSFPSLRLLFVAGEPFSGELANRWALPGRRFINAYGPTETTVVVTLMECQGQTWKQSPPIGKPMPNHHCYVLDRNRNPVPVGVPGELHVSGIGLARGYLNSPDLTAERFFMHSIDGAPAVRMYKTGDRVRYLPDGNIEFLGRIDRQVKIRGLRIELGEIEAALSQHPAVKQLTVIVREDKPGDKRLVAYLVADPIPSVSTLRDFLGQHLPSYMIPAAFVFLESLPLRSSGKIDQAALPAPESFAHQSTQSVAAPRTPLEEIVLTIWQGVLGVKHVGIYDNFFELGGSSLQVIHMVSQLRMQLGVTIAPRTVFETPTVAELAARLDGPAASEWSPLVAIRASGKRAPLFCIHPSGGSVFCYAELARHLSSDQPIFGLQAPGLEGEQAVCKGIEEMAQLYIQAVLHVQPEGPYHIIGWSLGGVVAFEMARQLEARGSRVALLGLLDSVLPDAGSSPVSDAELVHAFAYDLASIGGMQFPIYVNSVTHLTLEEQLGTAVEALKKIGAIAEDIGPSHIHHRFHVFQAMIRASQVYQPQPLAGRAVLYRAAGTPDSTPVWANLTGAGLQVHTVPGDHYTILRLPHVRTLASRLEEDLNQT